jgi:Flp pilus assembly protein TadD
VLAEQPRRPPDETDVAPGEDARRRFREELAMQSAYDAFQEGNRLLASQNPHAAVIPLERARDLEPDKGSVRETLARAYFRTGRFTQASEEFERAVEIEPVNDYAHFGLGLCLMRRGDDVGARRHLKLAVAMRPDQQDYRAALARVTDDA